MSKYTTQLRWIVEQLSQGLDTPEGQNYPDAVYKYIGLNEYPIFDESYRVTLNDMIINHYYFREIGFETAAQFAWYLKRTMREIMPKYNMMYQAIIDMQGIDNPLSDYARHRIENWNAHVDEISNTKNSSDSTGLTNSKDDSRNVFQDTPMSLLSNSGSPSIENLDYATNVTYNNDISEVNSKNKSNSNSDTDRDRDDIGERTVDEWGRNKSFAALIKEFYDNFMNVDLMVIEDLNDLFMGLW